MIPLCKKLDFAHTKFFTSELVGRVSLFRNKTLKTRRLTKNASEFNFSDFTETDLEKLAAENFFKS